jgi:hypothetical protein
VYTWSIKITGAPVSRSQGWQVRASFRRAGFSIREHFDDRTGASPARLFWADHTTDSAITLWLLQSLPTLESTVLDPRHTVRLEARDLD